MEENTPMMQTASAKLRCLAANFEGLRFAISMERAIAAKYPGFTYAKKGR